MAKTDKVDAVEKTDAPKKHFITITDEKGVYAPTPLAECNADAHGFLLGRKRREQGVMKQITSVVSQALKRA